MHYFSMTAIIDMKINQKLITHFKIADGTKIIEKWSTNLCVQYYSNFSFCLFSVKDESALYLVIILELRWISVAQESMSGMLLMNLTHLIVLASFVIYLSCLRVAIYLINSIIVKIFAENTKKMNIAKLNSVGWFSRNLWWWDI